MTRQVGLAEIGQISVPGQDVERATGFYRDRLGMRYLFAAPPGLSFFACGSVRLMLGRPEGPDRPAARVRPLLPGDRDSADLPDPPGPGGPVPRCPAPHREDGHPRFMDGLLL